MSYFCRLCFYSVFVALFFGGQVLAQVLTLPESTEMYDQKRDFGQVCPPDFESTREIIDRFLVSRFPSIFVRPEGLSVLVDIPELTQADFALLEDSTHRGVCTTLNETYAEQWERVISIHPDIEPMFLYDIAYYLVNDHYLVIRAGGNILVPSPDVEGQEIIYIDHLNEGIIVYDRELNQLSIREIEVRVDEIRAAQAESRDY